MCQPGPWQGHWQRGQKLGSGPGQQPPAGPAQMLRLFSLSFSSSYVKWVVASSRHSGEAMAPHSSTLVWKISWTEEPGGLQSMGSLESDTTERLHFHFSLSCIGEGNGTPLQYSCLENPMDGGAWWAAISGVAQSRTRLKRLSSSSSSSSISPRFCAP